MISQRWGGGFLGGGVGIIRQVILFLRLVGTIGRARVASPNPPPQANKSVLAQDQELRRQRSGKGSSSIEHCSRVLRVGA